MWTLEIYRVINSIGVWLLVGKYSVADISNAIIDTYALEYRVTSPDGHTHAINWVESKLDPDYTIPMIGEVCNEWPQHVGPL